MPIVAQILLRLRDPRLSEAGCSSMNAVPHQATLIQTSCVEPPRRLDYWARHDLLDVRGPGLRRTEVEDVFRVAGNERSEGRAFFDGRYPKRNMWSVRGAGFVRRRTIASC